MICFARNSTVVSIHKINVPKVHEDENNREGKLNRSGKRKQRLHKAKRRMRDKKKNMVQIKKQKQIV